MKRPAFLEGVLLAAALGLAASLAAGLFLPLAGAGTIARGLVAALGFGYVIYLLSRSRRTTGRVTTVAAWWLLAFLAWWGAPSFTAYLALHVVAVWLVRSLYFHAGILPALADLALNALAVAASVWALSHTGSVFLAVWSFFLAQALFAAIPPSARGRRSAGDRDAERFARAERRAEAALRRLAGRQIQ